MGRKQDRIYQQLPISAKVQSDRSSSQTTTASGNPLLNLQRSLGNQTLQRLIAERGENSIQTLLQTGQIGADSAAPDISREDEIVDTARQHFDEGLAEYQDGNYRGAIVRFERARQVPGLEENIYHDILFNIGRCNLELERYATAVMYFEEYLERGGTDTERVEPLLQQARAATGQDAETILNREGAAIPPETDDPAANVNRATALYDQASDLYQRHQYRQAIIIFEQLREMQNVEGVEDIHRTTLFNIARCNLRLRRYATAIIYLEEYLEDAEDAQDRAQVFDLLIEAQENAGAMTTREQVGFLLRLCEDAYENNEFETIIRLSEVIQQMSIDDAELATNVHYNIGLAYHRLGRHAEAVPHLRRYVETHPGDQEAAQILAEAEERSGLATPEAATL